MFTIAFMWEYDIAKFGVQHSSVWKTTLIVYLWYWLNWWDVSLTMWEVIISWKYVKEFEDLINTHKPHHIEFIQEDVSMRYVSLTQYSKHIQTWDIYIKTR